MGSTGFDQKVPWVLMVWYSWGVGGLRVWYQVVPLRSVMAAWAARVVSSRGPRWRVTCRWAAAAPMVTGSPARVMPGISP